MNFEENSKEQIEDNATNRTCEAMLGKNNEDEKYKQNVKLEQNDESVACLVIGLISLFAWLVPVAGFIIGNIGIALSVKGMGKNKSKAKTVICFIFSILTIFLSYLLTIAVIVVSIY